MLKKVLVISDGLVHPPLVARRRFKKILDSVPELDCGYASSIEALRLLPSGQYHGLVIYLHRKKISGYSLSALKDFVEGGGGFLAVHSASASFKSSDAYFEILGGRFAGHGKVGPFTLRPLESGVFRGIDAFTIKDELYLHEYDKNNTVHFDTERPDGGREPQVWTRPCGCGRVCYFAPGHCASTMNSYPAAEVIKRGLLWTCGIE